jgi:carbon starvation protein
MERQTSGWGSGGMKQALSVLVWSTVVLLGTLGYLAMAMGRDEPINAGWILIAAFCTYTIAYRFYSKWLAAEVLTLNDRRATPCEVHEDGRDFVKTNKWIVFGHHFAAISGPGPLVGPVLAAQFGYLPGTLWILIGVVLGGAVQDFIILFASMRRNGKSLGEMVKEEIGKGAGLVALTAIVSIMIILIAVLGLVVVKALAESPWGTFTIAMTIPIAMFMGIYLRLLRPGKVLEVTALGVVLLLLAVWGGQAVSDHAVLSKVFTLTPKQLAWSVIIYGLAASILPVWLLLAPRDYLSTFMKLGTIGALAVGILLVLPAMQMPALTQFVDGTGPVFAGDLFPFCFITIACGAISGFHSLISSGTTPKIITREGHARPVGYGSMLLESGVAIMAMIAACTLDPGIYFAMNSPAAIVGATAEEATAKITSWGYPVTPEKISTLSEQIHEKTILGRAGGAPTLAVGMANIFSKVIGGDAMMALWYHFAIMFEALFILTTVDAGTRVGRFLIQAFLGNLWKPLGNTHSYTANVFASVLLVSAWGYFLYQGVVAPLGGINSLWPLFGIANQLLAIVALCLGTTVLIKMGKKKHAWVTLLPMVWLVTVTFTAGLQKIFHPLPRIGFLSSASDLAGKLTAGLIPQAKIEATQRMIFNAHLNAVVTSVFLVLVGLIIATSVWRWYCLWTGRHALDLKETEPVWLPEQDVADERKGFAAWIFGCALLGFGLVRQLSGQAQTDRAIEQAAAASSSPCCGSEREKNARELGRVWAESEERRFQNPRCC